MPSLKDMTATIGHWIFGGGGHTPRVEVPGTADVDRAIVKHGVIATINGRATIGHFTVPTNASVHVTGTADVTHIALPKNASVKIDSDAQVRSITVPKGTSVKIAGNAEITGVRVTKALTISNVHGTAVIDNAAVAPGKHLSVGNVGGTAVIQNVIPAPGKHLTISGVSGTAEIAGVTLKKGATVNVAGGTATVNTLNAKAIKLDPGAIGSALGSASAPLTMYVKYDVVGGLPTLSPPGGGHGSGSAGPIPVVLDAAKNIGEIAAGSLIAMAAYNIGSKGIGVMLPWLAKLVGKGGKGPGDGGEGPGGGGPITNILQKEQDAARARDALATEQARLAKSMDRSLANKPWDRSQPPRQARGKQTPPTTSDVPWAVDALKNVFTTAFKSGGVIAAVGLGLAGLFKSGPAIAAAGRGLAGTMDAAFGSLIALITFPLKGLKTSNKPGAGGGQQVAAAYAGAGLDLAILGFGKAIVGKIGDGIKSKLADLLGIGKWIIDSIKAGIKGLVPTAPKGANTDTRTYGHGSGGKPPTGHPRGEGHWIPVSGNTWVWAPGKPPGHPGNTAGLTPGASGVGAHGVALAHIDTAMLRRMGALTTTPAHHAAAAAQHATVHHSATQQHQTINVGGIHINGAQDPHAVAKEVVEALKSVSSAAHRKRQHGR